MIQQMIKLVRSDHCRYLCKKILVSNNINLPTYFTCLLVLFYITKHSSNLHLILG